jgi:hypothetical protein
MFAWIFKILFALLVIYTANHGVGLWRGKTK